MRKALILVGAVVGFLVGAVTIGFCEPVVVVKERSFFGAGTLTAVSISTSAWTVAPTASSLSLRSGVAVRNPSTNNAAVLCTCAGAVPATAITIADAEIPVTAGLNTRFFWCDNNLKLYCRSLHTSAESINVKEYRQ